MQGSVIGVGPALRKARVHRGVSIDEASRDTKIRVELLQALEKEEFEALLGDVYVRGCLRSYSTYLGLNPDRVVSAYAKGRAAPEVAPAGAAPVAPAIEVTRRRDNHRLAVLIAATVLAVAAALGVLSRSRTAPAPAHLPTSPQLGTAADQSIIVSLDATRAVKVAVTADGVTHMVSLRPGEGRSFQATASLTVRLSRGGTANITVNGRDLGVRGRTDRPWTKTFSFEGTGATPSPTG